MKLMKKLLDLNGIITVLNTPFTIDNEVDYKSLLKNVNVALDAGVAGFLVPAMASEVSKLSIDEKDKMVSAVVKAVGKKNVKVIGGCYSNDDIERVNLAKNLIDLGCDGVLINIPYKDKDHFFTQIDRIAKLEPSFIMVQDWDFSGYGIPIPTILELFKKIDRFKAIKVEVIPAGAKYTEIIEKTNGLLHTSGGWAVMQMIEGLDRGIHAFMPTGMHYIYTKIYSLYKNGKKDKALQLFNDILPILAFSNQHLDISIHFFKRLLYKQGIYSTPKVREPILNFDDVHISIADRHIERIITITNDIKNNKYS